VVNVLVCNLGLLDFVCIVVVLFEEFGMVFEWLYFEVIEMVLVFDFDIVVEVVGDFVC